MKRKGPLSKEVLRRKVWILEGWISVWIILDCLWIIYSDNTQLWIILWDNIQLWIIYWDNIQLWIISSDNIQRRERRFWRERETLRSGTSSERLRDEKHGSLPEQIILMMMILTMIMMMTMMTRMKTTNGVGELMMLKFQIDHWS